MTKGDLKSLLYKLKADNIDEEEFEYYWQRTLFNLKQFKEISMNEEGIIRSHSLARLSFRCRFEILFIETLLRFKFQILGFFSILILSLIGYRKFKNLERKE
ncbi:unnamed protein product [[Candida] boidinii]|nr:unnamed protein product [[Candida] boidinii]